MRLQDVAKIAGVSASTVSRVVNGLPVNTTTRKHVLNVLKSTHYHPNLQARALVAGQTKTIGVIVSDLRNPFFIDIFQAIELDAKASGYEVLLANTNYDVKQLATAIRVMIGRRVSGLALVVSEELPTDISDIVKVDIPVAVYDVARSAQGITGVRFDYRNGMVQIMEYLRVLGHRRLAYVGLSSTLGPTDERLEVFAHQANSHSLKTTVLKASSLVDFEHVRAVIQGLLNANSEVTAIVCVNDVAAIAVMRVLYSAGIRVPADISVTGFDNIGFSQLTTPSLTTIHVPRTKIGHRLFAALVQDRSKQGEPAEFVFASELVVRESTGPAKVDR